MFTVQGKDIQHMYYSTIQRKTDTLFIYAFTDYNSNTMIAKNTSWFQKSISDDVYIFSRRGDSKSHAPVRNYSTRRLQYNFYRQQISRGPFDLDDIGPYSG